MSLREEQCNKVCRILDDVLANRPTERDSLIVAVQLAFEAQPEPLKIDLSGYSKEDWERFRKEWANTPITVLSAQPKKGRWISADAIFGGVPFYCSECGENTRDTVMGKPRWKFCPMCGSYNGGKKDDSV